MRHSRFIVALLTTTSLTGVGGALAQGLPTGASVQHGSVAVAAPSASALTITQSSPSAIVNWQGFSIGAGNRVDIVQPSSSSALLNRVTGSTPSTIAGQLNANGQVYLVNPNGIAITKSGTVNAAGFVGSTLGISDDDFKAGRNRFTGNGNSAAVSNAGAITIGPGGYAALLGGRVDNAGTITVPTGKVMLGAGEAATLDLSGDGFLQVSVPSGSTGKKALIRNSGSIRAGQVEMQAATARDAARNAINLSGVVEARSVGGRSGNIIIGGGAGGTVRTSGRLTAHGGSVQVSGRKVKLGGNVDVASRKRGGGNVTVSATDTATVSGTIKATSKSAQGGAITVTADTVKLRSATLDASGATGGGSVLIGGGYQGGGTLAHAQATSFDAASSIRADATGNGDGGKIVLWSDGTTTAHGTLSARGGPQGGNGGTVETSGHNVDFSGVRVSTQAPNGSFGQWLVDPEDLEVDSAAALTIGTNLATSNVTLTTTATTASGPGIVTPGGNGDIIISSALLWSAATTLTLSAYRDIAINAPIIAFGAGSGIVLRSDNTGTGVGTVAFNAGGFMDAATSMVTIYYNPVGDSTNVNGSKYATPTDFSGSVSAGTLSTYMLVNTVFDLQNINNNLNANYALGRDIDASATTTWNAGAGFVPLGTDGNSTLLNSGNGFNGTFDGQRNIISGLTINRAGSSRVGLFGYSQGVINNLGVTDAQIVGQDGVGALAGQAAGGTINQVYATGTVTGQTYVGGLVGINSGDISRAYTNVVVEGGSLVGGLIGQHTGQLSLAYALGPVSGSGGHIGGLVGSSFGIISTSYATGQVTGASAGGLVGAAAGPISSSFWDVDTTGQVYASESGAVAGVSPLGGINPGARTQTSYAGWNFATDWYMVEGQTRPFGQWEAQTNITNTHQLQLVQLNPGASYTLGRDFDLLPELAGVNGQYPGMWGAAGFVPVGTSPAPFSGTFNGQSHVLSGLTIDRPTESNVGLFGVINAAGVVKDLGLKGAVVSGQSNVGTLAGSNDGTITNSYTTVDTCGCGEVYGGSDSVGGLVGVNSGTLNFVHSDVSVYGAQTSNMGGLVGFAAGGTISNAYATGDVIGDPTDSLSSYVGGLIGGTNTGVVVTNAYATGTVAGYFAVGGLIGNNLGGVTNSYASGNIYGEQNLGGLIGYNGNADDLSGNGTLTRVFATGAVMGDDAASSSAGGLVGANNGKIVDAYATGAVLGGDKIGGLIGQNAGDVTNVYATGLVNLMIGAPPTLAQGALIGENDFNLTNGYWNTETSGQSQAVGVDAGSTTFAQTTTSLQAALPSGFSTGVWGLIPGISYPYLKWRFPSGPTVVSGTVSGVADGNAGLNVELAADNTVLTNQFTGANGYYHFMVDPRAAGTGVMTYLTAEALDPSRITYAFGASLAALTADTAPAFAQGHASKLDIADSRLLVRADLPTLTDIYSLMNATAGNLPPQYTGFITLCGCGSMFTLPGVNVRIENGPTALTIDTQLITFQGKIEVIAAGDLTVQGDAGGGGGFPIPNLAADGTVLLSSKGTLSLTGSGPAIESTAAGNAVTLIAGGAFKNLTSYTDSPITLDDPSARWLVYSQSPGANTFGSNLDSGNTAIWNTTYLTSPPANVTQPGNRYIFALQPTLTFTANAGALSKTYGDTLDISATPVTVSGVQTGVAGAFLGDTAAQVYTGAPVLSSAGTVATANVAGSPYPFILSPGTLTALNGYQFAFATTGGLTVTPRNITVAGVGGIDKMYDATTALPSGISAFIATGGLAGDDVHAIAANSVYDSPNAGTHAINVSGLALTGAAAGNYTLGGINAVTGSGTITPRPISVVADPQAKVAGAQNPVLTYKVGGAGFLGADGLIGGLATAATLSSPAGLYLITQGSLAPSSLNYTISFTSGILAVSAAPVPPEPPLPSGLDPAWLASTVMRDEFAPLIVPFGSPPTQISFGDPNTTVLALNDPRFAGTVVCFTNGTCQILSP